MSASVHPSEPTVTVWGAARAVTGSMHLVEACGQRILLDCGQSRGPRNETTEPRRVPVRPEARSTPSSSATPTSTTAASCPPGPPGLRRADLLHGRHARPDRSHARSTRPRIQEEDALVASAGSRAALADYRAVQPRRRVPDGRPMRTARLRTARTPSAASSSNFLDAGHLLGSAMVAMTSTHRRGRGRITFTGDLGRRTCRYTRRPAAVPPADLLLCESTYGGRTHDTIDVHDRAVAGRVVRRTADRGGKVIVPAFSLGRTQTVVARPAVGVARRPARPGAGLCR